MNANSPEVVVGILLLLELSLLFKFLFHFLRLLSQLGLLSLIIFLAHLSEHVLEERLLIEGIVIVVSAFLAVGALIVADDGSAPVVLVHKREQVFLLAVQIVVGVDVVPAFSLLFVLAIRVEFVRVIDEVALAHLLRHQLLETLEVFAAKHLPVLELGRGNEVAIEQVRAGELERLALILALVKLLDELNSLLELHRHLVDLSRLHVHVIDFLWSNVTSLARYSGASLSYILVLNGGFSLSSTARELLKLHVSLPELFDDKSLQVRHINDIVLAANLHHDLHAELACDGAVAIV